MTEKSPNRGDLARGLGYSLFGSRFDYILHLRLAEWPIMAGHTALGYLLAVGVGGAWRAEQLGAALAGLLLWVVCLNGGTLALNSAFDRDEGDIGYLRAPPPPPPHLAGFGFGLMVLGQAVALLLPSPFALAYAACFALSLLYSVPPFRFKAVAGVDWIINMWGFGTLTPFAGYAATGRLPTAPHAIVLLAFCPLFGALYPLTQLYQFEEDTRRGDRTLALILGMRKSLQVALGAAVVAFLCFGTAAAKSDWGTTEAWRWGVLVIAALGWTTVLLPWLKGYQAMTPADHQRGMYRALLAWAVTDLAVVLAWGV